MSLRGARSGTSLLTARTFTCHGRLGPGQANIGTGFALARSRSPPFLALPVRADGPSLILLSQLYNKINDDPHVDRDDREPDRADAPHEFVGLDGDETAGGDDRQISGPPAFE